jgi:inorganic pyrophosphatase
MPNYAALPHGLDRKAHACRAVIETPRGAPHKLSFDPVTEAFALKRVLPLGMCFPLDFGFVPSTRAEDGAPIDVMVLADSPLPVGCVLDVRVVGAIEAEQTKDRRRVRNDRLIAAAQASHLYAAIRALGDLPAGMAEQLIAFWTNYNALRGESFQAIGVATPARACALIAAASGARSSWSEPSGGKPVSTSPGPL